MMNQKEALCKEWLHEEEIAHIHGWDFSHIHERYEEENDLPWNYKEIIQHYLKPEMRLLDVDTGGGEFLLSLHHPCSHLAATENYPPNVELCKKTLIPLGVDFRQGDGRNELPFEDECFDMIINRHGDFNPKDIARLLKKGGLFITKQVGAQNDRELVELLLEEVPEIPFPQQYLSIAQDSFERLGFSTLKANEAFRPIQFYDVGALVWFARIIEWEFPGFDVMHCLEQLYHAQDILEEKGVIEGQIHRFLLVVQK